MQNQEIVKIIENLKGRRNYEEKKASKLGFATLYDYLEDKISKKQKSKPLFHEFWSIWDPVLRSLGPNAFICMKNAGRIHLDTSRGLKPRKK